MQPTSSKRLGLLCAMGVSLLAACTMEPRYRQPSLPVQNRWPLPESGVTAAASIGDVNAATGATAAWEIGWRDFFADPELQELISQALANNRDLRVSVLNIELASAQYHIQRSQLLPSINASGSYTREKLPPAIVFGSLPPAAGSFASGNSAVFEKLYEAGVGVTNYEIDFFGRVRSLNHASLQQYLAQEQARRSAQLSLIAQVANAYLTLESDQESERLAVETLKSQQASYDMTSKRHDSGAVSGLDVAQARTTVESARADVARFEGNVALDLNLLTLLVGSAIDESKLPQGLDAGVIGLTPLPAGLPSDVLLRRPDILQAEHQLLAANADIGAARAAFFPTISLTSSLGSASTTLSGLFKAGSGSWLFEPQASVPIFHGGALIGNLSVAHTNREIAVAQYEKAIQSGFREVSDALALTATLDRQHSALQALVDATQLTYQLSQQRYRTGADSYLNVLDAQRSYYSAQQELIAIRLAEQSNRVTLYKTLGGGWQEHSGKTASNN